MHMKAKVWSPSKDDLESSHLSKFIKQVNAKENLQLSTFDDIHQWSVKSPEKFWQMSSTYLNIQYNAEPTKIVDDINNMPYSKWFIGATLNYAENCLQTLSNDLAIYEVGENGLLNTITWEELYNLTSKWANYFKSNGIKKGDRVAGILPNNLTAVVAMLGANEFRRCLEFLFTRFWGKRNL